MSTFSPPVPNKELSSSEVSYVRPDVFIFMFLSFERICMFLCVPSPGSPDPLNNVPQHDLSIVLVLIYGEKPITL